MSRRPANACIRLQVPGTFVVWGPYVATALVATPARPYVVSHTSKHVGRDGDVTETQQPFVCMKHAPCGASERA